MPTNSVRLCVGRRCYLVEAGNRLSLVFNAGNYIQQVHRFQNQSHISVRPQQFQACTPMLKEIKRSHNGSDARRIQLRNIGQI
jgi:predicted lipase